MPVTTRPSPSRVGKNRDRELALHADERTVFDTVTSDCHSPYEGERWQSFPYTGFQSRPIIASSIDSKATENADSGQTTVSVYNNGFVDGLIRAFNQDLHLVIRPDDVWQAIISQFSLFVNGNAERLRDLFVNHEGKRKLIVDLTPQGLSELDLGTVAEEFTSKIQDSVVDPELREWMTLVFSTTTPHDKAVAAFGMMGAMQQYFEYEMMCGCGLPSVTLLGIRDDWEMLANQLDRLDKYGEERKNWARLLKPVMRYMLRTFDEPDSQEVKDFWLRVAHEAGSEGSSGGIRTLSGWITAFAYFDENGKPAKDYKEEDIENVYGGTNMPLADFYFDRYLDMAVGDDARACEEVKAQRSRGMTEHGYPGSLGSGRKRLTLEGVSYPLIRPADIPRGISLLPITIVDMEAGLRRFTTAISGTIGMSISENGTTAQPVSAWWVVQEFAEPM